MRLIDKYLPSDYSDTVSKRIKPAEPLSSDHIFEEMFCNFPWPVAWLFKLRNFLANILHRDLGVPQDSGKESVPKNIDTCPTNGTRT